MNLRDALSIIPFLVLGLHSVEVPATVHEKQVASPATAPMSEGEVKKVDKQLGKITIKHGPLVNLKMPPMTMVFQVKDKALLEHVKEGDAIRFIAEKEGSQYFVSTLEPKQ